MDDDSPENVMVSLRLGSVAHRGPIPRDALEPFSGCPELAEHFDQARYDHMLQHSARRAKVRAALKKHQNREAVLAACYELPHV